MLTCIETFCKQSLMGGQGLFYLFALGFLRKHGVERKLGLVRKGFSDLVRIRILHTIVLNLIFFQPPVSVRTPVQRGTNNAIPFVRSIIIIIIIITPPMDKT